MGNKQNKEIIPLPDRKQYEEMKNMINLYEERDTEYKIIVQYFENDEFPQMTFKIDDRIYKSNVINSFNYVDNEVYLMNVLRIFMYENKHNIFDAEYIYRALNKVKRKRVILHNLKNIREGLVYRYCPDYSQILISKIKIDNNNH